jgi:hypothetical protein
VRSAQAGRTLSSWGTSHKDRGDQWEWRKEQEIPLSFDALVHVGESERRERERANCLPTQSLYSFYCS